MISFKSNSSYRYNNWNADLLELKNNDLTPKDPILRISFENINGLVDEITEQDNAYLINEDIAVIVLLHKNKILVINCSTCAIIFQYIEDTSSVWLHSVLHREKIALNSIVKNRKNDIRSSIFILSTKGIINYQLRHDYSVSKANEYKFQTNSSYKSMNIVNEPQGGSFDYSVYMLLRDKHIIHKAHFHEETVRIVDEIKIKLPKENELCDLYFSMDDVANSAIIADKGNNTIYECLIRNGKCTVISGNTDNAYKEEAEATNVSLMHPLSPVIYRIQSFVSKNIRFTEYSLNVINSDKSGIYPRLLLFCEHNSIKKIWQFPNTTDALDRAGISRIYTLMGKNQTANNIDEYSHPLLFQDVNKPNGIHISSTGDLIIKCFDELIILRSGISAAEKIIYSKATNLAIDES
jgi:hypothetical protein